MLRSSRSGAANRTERARAPLSSAQSCRYSFPFGRCGESFLRLCFFFSARSLKRKKSNAPRPPQDGSYLSELLLDKGYVVHGLKRRASSYNHPRIEHIMDSSEFLFFFFGGPGRERIGCSSSTRERERVFGSPNDSKTNYRLPRLGALLPPLRRPHRLWFALPAAQVRREKKEKRGREDFLRVLVIFSSDLGVSRRAMASSGDRDRKTQKINHFFLLLLLLFSSLDQNKQKNSATKPDEIYNLGAQSHVQVSFQLPQYTAEASGVVSFFLILEERERERGEQASASPKRPNVKEERKEKKNWTSTLLSHLSLQPPTPTPLHRSPSLSPPPLSPLSPRAP